MYQLYVTTYAIFSPALLINLILVLWVEIPEEEVKETIKQLQAVLSRLVYSDLRVVEDLM